MFCFESHLMIVIYFHFIFLPLTIEYCSLKCFVLNLISWQLFTSVLFFAIDDWILLSQVFCFESHLMIVIYFSFIFCHWQLNIFFSSVLFWISSHDSYLLPFYFFAIDDWILFSQVFCFESHLMTVIYFSFIFCHWWLNTTISSVLFWISSHDSYLLQFYFLPLMIECFVLNLISQFFSFKFYHCS